MRKKTLLAVPVYCVVAGFVSFYLVVYILGRFAVTTLPDGTVTIDSAREVMVYGLVMALAVLIGTLGPFRSMTRKELFYSASVMVGFQLLVILAQYLLSGGQGVTASFWIYLSQVGEWSRFVSQLPLQTGLTDNLWLAGVLESFAPYVFVLFGRKTPAKVTA